MQVDWLTVAAQIVNFLVLVWLLQRFLYAPIIQAMERREARIAERLSDAEQKRQAADAEAEKLRRQQAELERARKDLLAEARDQAAQERRSLEHQTRSEVETQKRAWLDQLSAERKTFLADLRERSTDAIFELAGRALDDLASAELEAAMAEAFARQLAALDDEEKRKLADGAGRAGNRVTIESRFALDADAKVRLARAVHEELIEGIEIEHRTDPDLDCGIALQAGSQRVSWSMAHYLKGLEETVEAELAKAGNGGGEGRGG